MQWAEQGAEIGMRYVVIPRTLCFVLNQNQLLLLRGAPHKRLWANKLNGIGGHIEAGETPYECACRELYEEAGLEVPDLQLRGIVHISSDTESAGIMLFVYVGHVLSSQVYASSEGSLEWHPVQALPASELVEDLPELIPQVLAARNGQIVYGLYQADKNGRMTFQFMTIGESNAN